MRQRKRRRRAGISFAEENASPSRRAVGRERRAGQVKRGRVDVDRAGRAARAVHVEREREIGFRGKPRAKEIDRAAGGLARGVDVTGDAAEGVAGIGHVDRAAAALRPRHGDAAVILDALGVDRHAAAGLARGVDGLAVPKRAALDCDLATVLARLRCDDAGILDQAAVGGEENAAALLRHGGRADRAFVIDGQREHVAVGRLQFRAGRGDRAAVLHRRLGRRRGRRGRRADEDVLLAAEIQDDIVAGGQAGRSARGVDRAFIVDSLADEKYVAAERVDHSHILHTGGVAAGEVEVAGKKIAVADVARAGHEPVGVDRAGRADDNAVAVDQHNLPIGGKGAVNGGNPAAEHAIERCRGRAGLDKLRQLARTDGEGLPVDDGGVARLVDRDRSGYGGDRG